MKEVKVKIALDAKDANKEADNLKKTLKEIDGIDIESPFDEIYGEAKSLTQVMGGLQDRLYELAQAGDTNSKEFKVLTAETARLRKAQIRVDRAVDATARTLGEKLANSANMAASAYSILQGAMGAMNLENEEMEKSMQRVLSAMAVAQGVSGFTTALQGTRMAMIGTAAATKVATAAQWLWNAAMTANPIGAIIVAVTALISGIVALTSWMSSNTKAAKQMAENNKKVSEELDSTADSLDNAKEANKEYSEELDRSHDREMQMAKARGESKEELRKLALSQADAKIAQAKLNEENSRAAVINTTLALSELKKREAIEGVSEALTKQIEKAQENADKARELNLELDGIVDKAIQSKDDLVFSFKVEDTTEANKPKETKETKTSGKTPEEIEEEKQQKIQAIKDTYTEQSEIDKINRREEALLKELESIEMDETLKNEMRAEIEAKAEEDRTTAKLDAETKRKEAIDALLNSFKEVKDEEALESELEDEEEEYQKGLKKLEELGATHAEIEAFEETHQANLAAIRDKWNEKDRIERLNSLANNLEIAKKYAQAVNSLANGMFAISNNLGQQDEKSKEERAKKQFKVQKALNLSMAAIDGGLAITRSIAKYPPTTPLGIASLVAVSAATAASLATIASTKFDSSSVSTPSPTRTEPAQAPSFNLVEGTNDSSAIQESIQNQSNSPIKAYVVSGEVSSAQELDRNVSDSTSL